MAVRMRWRFPDPSENDERGRILGRIDAWWAAFASASARLEAFFEGRDRWDLAGFMRENLGAVDPRIRWEFGTAACEGTGRRLVLTPESERRARPLVDVVLARAPMLVGWELQGHRPPESVASALRSVAERASVDLTGFQARAVASGDGLVDVTLVPPATAAPTAATRGAAVNLVEALVGEAVAEVWIGDVDVSSRPIGGAALAGLAGAVRALVDAHAAAVSELPYCRRTADAKWTLLRLAPKESAAADYRGQEDMLVAKTVDFGLWRAQHGGRPFHSCRFSRSGETMATLKIDGGEGLAPDGLGDKAAIEDAIADALEARGLGGQVGGGTGLRYSYVDLALTDVEAAMAALRPVLRAGKLPRRTWLLFFDADLADEWIPLWDDAPPPP
jgi:hypothetical protein